MRLCSWARSWGQGRLSPILLSVSFLFLSVCSPLHWMMLRAGVAQEDFLEEGALLHSQLPQTLPVPPPLLSSLLPPCRCRQLLGATENAASTAPCLCTCLVRCLFCWRPPPARIPGGAAGAGAWASSSARRSSEPPELFSCSCPARSPQTGAHPQMACEG